MLQRIQSLYLLVAAIAFAMLFFINVYKVETTTEPISTVSMNATSINVLQNANMAPVPPQFQLFPFVLTLVSFILAIVAIFWYKNRVQQNLLTKLLILLNTGLLVLFLLSTDKLIALAGSAPNKVVYQPGIVLPFISLLMIYLASRSIMKDEKLVRSADRLR